jgi:hypothetical protein
LALCGADLFEGQEKNISGLRRNSLTRRPFKLIPLLKRRG